MKFGGVSLRYLHLSVCVLNFCTSLKNSVLFERSVGVFGLDWIELNCRHYNATWNVDYIGYTSNGPHLRPQNPTQSDQCRTPPPRTSSSLDRPLDRCYIFASRHFFKKSQKRYVVFLVKSTRRHATGHQPLTPILQHCVYQRTIPTTS
jgi:hypothetical protein